MDSYTTDSQTEAEAAGAGDGLEEVSLAAQDGSPEATIHALQIELAAAQAQAADHLDRLQRATADFQNTNRRQERRLLEGMERASQALILRMLPVLDDFELAFGNLPATLTESDGAWVAGFRQIQKKLSEILGEEGLTPIDETGSPFDPTRHEAISHEPSDRVASGHIIQTLRAGYEHKGRILRPALVRVAM